MKCCFSACEDSHVRIWRVPDEGVKETMTEPAAELAGTQRLF